MSDTILNPYLSFKDGKAKEAMEFYKSVFGGELDILTFGSVGMPGMEGKEDLIMHSALMSGSMNLFGSDAMKDGDVVEGTNVSISLSGTDEAELKGYFDKLSKGGKVVEPFAKAPWGDMFGMVDDKYGIHWLINGGAAKQ